VARRGYRFASEVDRDAVAPALPPLAPRLSMAVLYRLASAGRRGYGDQRANSRGAPTGRKGRSAHSAGVRKQNFKPRHDASADVGDKPGPFGL
jgi:hypothetical protein